MQIRDATRPFVVLLASLAACTEDASPTPTAPITNGGTAGSNAAAGSSGAAGSSTSTAALAPCAVPAGAVAFTKSCGAPDGSLCLSAWGYDIHGCKGTVGDVPCPTADAAAVP